MSNPPAMSVVLATLNRADSLERFLTSLEAQAGPPPFEVIVADNGSTDATPDLLARWSTLLDLRSVRVDVRGKGYALNAALQLARGSLVVLTDDDVRPDPGWLAELHETAQANPDATVFGGPIIVDQSAVPRWLRRSHKLTGLATSEHGSAYVTDVYGYGRYPFGPNLAFRRERLAGIESPYPVDMGPGTRIPVGDEAAFLMQVSPPWARDRLFVPDARVDHDVEPHNLTFRSMLRRSYAQGLSQARLEIPAVPPSRSGEPGSDRSLPRLVLDRILLCRSLREFVCVCAMHLGHLLGSRDLNPSRSKAARL